MTAFPSYSTGSVSVADGGTTVTGSGSNWTGTNAKPGDLLQIGEFQTIVSDVTDATHLVVPPWGGGVQSGAAYVLWKISPLRFAGGDAMADVSMLVGALNTDGYFVFVGPAETEPDPSYGEEGQFALQPSTGEMWEKSGGVWVDAGLFGKGIASGIRQAYSTTTTDADPGAGIFRLNHATPASATAAYLDNVDAGGATVSGIFDLFDDSTNATRGFIRFQKESDPAVWAQFRVTGSVVDGTGYRKLTLVSGAGSGSFTASDMFTITFYRSGDAGTNGTNGTNGVGYGGTSTTSLAIGTGSKVFTTQAGLAYQVGNYARASSTANGANYMEGFITAYSGTSLTVNVTKVGGSGTLADWNFSISGAPGSGDLLSTNNLSDLADAQTARGNLGIKYPPQGRLTLQTAVPVMITTQSAKTTIYYTPYVGDQILLYDGTRFTPTTFAEISVATTDTAKNPAAIGASKVNDWFVWNDSGTLRLSHGPDWTNDTTRSAGTALTMVNGILLNNATITNGPAASRGTYVGTTRSNGSSQLDWIIGGSASGGTAGFLGVWNAYNRRPATAKSYDNGSSYTYSSATVRQARASAGNQVSAVFGLAEDSIDVKYNARVTTAATNAAGVFGVGMDSTSAFFEQGFTAGGSATSVTGAGTSGVNVPPQLGFHVFSANEQSDGTNANTFDVATQNAFSVLAMM